MGDLKQKVRERYAEAALSAGEGSEGGGSCCGGGAACCGTTDTEALEVDMVRGAYSEAERSEMPRPRLPWGAATLSLGEVVLDLGSGGGIDVLLSARRVAPGGKAYGLDMTDEMLELARRNRAESGV